MKNKIVYLFLIIVTINPLTYAQEIMKYNELTPFEQKIILDKGTEAPWTGKYVHNEETGTYLCKRCNAPLYRSADKFDAHCGWPSFDDEIPGAVKRVPDADGIRTEIICANCGAHLGHVFEGEKLTPKNVRHCVNSVSLNFIPAESSLPQTERAIFAAGCFWGTEYYFRKAPGVILTTVGYTGGHKDNPTYREVCSGTTGHKEAIEIIFDPTQTTFEKLAKLFFEIHDFSQTDGQGPDLGEQYLSYIFYTNSEQKKVAEKLIDILRQKGYRVATKIEPAATFWKAEDYHQDYYQNDGKQPYCHIYRKIF
jgi:peptide methionine sulfoxide reductase msrA/msrB